MTYRHTHIKVRFKSNNFFSLLSGYVLVGTSGFTDGCVLMYHLFSLPAGFIQQRLVSFHVVLMKDHLVSLLVTFVGASVLTPGWVYVGVSGFTLRLWFSRNICFHSWLFFNVESVLTPCSVYAAVPGFIACWVYVGVSGFPPRLCFTRNIWFHSWVCFVGASVFTPGCVL